jgi:hypothetical protein
LVYFVFVRRTGNATELRYRQRPAYARASKPVFGTAAAQKSVYESRIESIPCTCRVDVCGWRRLDCDVHISTRSDRTGTTALDHDPSAHRSRCEI